MKSNTARWFSLIIGILVLLCGIGLIFTPLEAYLMISFFVPFAILTNGISGTVNYFSDKNNKSVSGWLLADGIIGIIIGGWLLFKPGITALSLPYVFGFWVLFAGSLRIAGSFGMKRISDKWGWLLLWGIIGVITGLVLLYHPVFAGTIVAYLVAWSFVFVGIQGIMGFFLFKGQGKLS